MNLTPCNMVDNGLLISVYEGKQSQKRLLAPFHTFKLHTMAGAHGRLYTTHISSLIWWHKSNADIKGPLSPIESWPMTHNYNIGYIYAYEQLTQNTFFQSLTSF